MWYVHVGPGVLCKSSGHNYPCSSTVAQSVVHSLCCIAVSSSMLQPITLYVCVCVCVCVCGRFARVMKLIHSVRRQSSCWMTSRCRASTAHVSSLTVLSAHLPVLSVTGTGNVTSCSAVTAWDHVDFYIQPWEFRVVEIVANCKQDECL